MSAVLVEHDTPAGSMPGSVLCGALYFGMLQVRAGVEIKLGRREGMKKEKKNKSKKQVKT